MKTLIIHPKDKSTNFLKSIYKDIPYKTIITGGCHYTDVVNEMKTHDRIIMCGHGTPYGLLSVGQFLGMYIVYRDWETDRKSTRLNSSHLKLSRMPSSA